jgi:hypothetical protein
MDTYNKINDGLGEMWMYYRPLIMVKWGYELIYWNKN